MGYNKTAWVDNVTPLSASNLNKIEEGISGAHNAIKAINIDSTQLRDMVERNSYDDYLRTLELYYTGHFSGPSIDGLSGMFFDGFLNKDQINLGETTAEVDVSKKQATCPLDATSKNPTAISQTGSKWIDLNNVIDGSPSTYATANLSYEESLYVTCDITLPQPQSVKSLSIRAKADGNTYQWTYNTLRVSQDGENWIDIVPMGTSKLNIWSTTNVPTAATTGLVDFEQLYFCKYIQIRFELRNTSEDYTIRATWYYIQANVEEYQNSSLQSKMKDLLVNWQQGKLYLTADIPPGCEIVPKVNNGGNWEDVYLSDTRSDPLENGFDEMVFDIDLTDVGDELTVKFELKADITKSKNPTIKRYAIMW